MIIGGLSKDLRPIKYHEKAYLKGYAFFDMDRA